MSARLHPWSDRAMQHGSTALDAKAREHDRSRRCSVDGFISGEIEPFIHQRATSDLPAGAAYDCGACLGALCNCWCWVLDVGVVVPTTAIVDLTVSMQHLPTEAEGAAVATGQRDAWPGLSL